MRAHTASICAVLIAAALSSAAQAGTVSGTITTDTWTATNNPYEVIDTLRIPAGETLTIEPGVEVYSYVLTPFIVEGSLVAVGTDADSIRFGMSMQPAARPSDVIIDAWAGITFAGTDTSTLSHVVLSKGGDYGEGDAGGGITASEGARVGISDSRIEGCSALNGLGVGGGILARDTSTVSVVDCYFEGNTAKIGGAVAVEPGADFSMSGCRLHLNTSRDRGAAVALFEPLGAEPLMPIDSPPSVRIERCIVTQNVAFDLTSPGESPGGSISLNAESGRLAVISQCTIAGNTGVFGAFLLYAAESVAPKPATSIEPPLVLGIYNTIIADNNGTDWLVRSGPTWGRWDVAYSNLFPATTVWDIRDGTISADPRFVSPETGNYSLPGDSPCINAGHGTLDADGTDPEMGAIPFTGSPRVNASGRIWASHWLPRNGDVHILDSVTVMLYGYVRIDPGVNVVWDAPAPLIVEGRMEAIGTEADSIRFLGAATQVVPGINSSCGLTFTGGDSSAMRYARVSEHRRWADLYYAMENTWDVGGGILVHGDETRLGLDQCVVTGNLSSRSGAGIAVVDSATLYMSKCTISGNSTTIMYGDFDYTGYADGGGLMVRDATAHLNACEIRGNFAGDGGGVASYYGTLTVDSCRIELNHGELGGGVYLHESDASIHRSAIVRNEVKTRRDGPNRASLVNAGGGGVWASKGELALGSTTIADNRGSGCSDSYEADVYAGGAMHLLSANGDIRDCIIWGNSWGACSGEPLEGGVVVDRSTLAAAYSIIQGDTVFAGMGNLLADPLFADPTKADYRLRTNSLAIDAGDPASPLDSDGSRADIGALPATHGINLLSLPHVAGLSGDTVAVTIRAALTDVAGVDMAFLAGSSLLTPVEPFVVDSWFAEVTANTVGDTVFVAMRNLTTVTAADTALVTLAFRVADVSPGVETRFRWVEYPVTNCGEAAAELLDGTFVVGDYPLGIDDAQPVEFALGRNFPNPFNPRTTIPFALSEQSHTRLSIYDVNGRYVRTLVNASMPAGRHRVAWDGCDASGRPVASGMYIYRLTSGKYNAVGRMLMVR